MALDIRIITKLIWNASKAACQHIFRTGFYPYEWPLRLAVIMGVNKAFMDCLAFCTIEEVLATTYLGLT